MHSAKDHKYELEQTFKVLQTYHNFLIQWFFFLNKHIVSWYFGTALTPILRIHGMVQFRN